MHPPSRSTCSRAATTAPCAIQGSATDATGSFTVRVNGDLFATITTDGDGTSTITGAEGNALTEEEMQALRAVFDMFANGFDFFEDLTDPISG